MSTTGLENWKADYQANLKQGQARSEELAPEPLFEAALAGEHMCLVCAGRTAKTALLTPTRKDPIVPLCEPCSADWNCYGYEILKKIRPLPLLLKAARWFVFHPLRRAVVWADLRRLLAWQKKMQGIRKALKRSSK